MANTVEQTLSGQGVTTPTLNTLFRSTKRKRRERFAEISFASLAIVDDLVAEAKASAKKGDNKKATRLLEIAQKVLDNNRNYQTLVGEVLNG